MLGRLRKLHLLRPLEGRSFRRLWLGQGLSLLADQTFFVALTLLVSRVAGVGVELGSVLAVSAIPGAVLTPVGGALADRFSPATLMVMASVGRAVLLSLLAAIVLLDAVALWHLYVIGGLLSVLDALYYPASLSIVPGIVANEKLSAANALVQGAEQISGMAGPALAAFSVASVGFGPTFGAGALLFAVSAGAFVGLFRIARFGPRPLGIREGRAASPQPANPQAANPQPGRAGPVGVSGIWEGVRAAWGDPVLRAMLFVLAAINLGAIGPVVVGGASLAEQRLGGADAFGILLSAFGAGSLLGVLAAGSVRRARRRGATFLGGAALLGVGVGALGFVPNLLWGSAVAGIMGLGSGYLGVVLIAWLQERVEERMRGRVMSLVVFVVVALDPVSYAAAGFLMEFGLTATFVSAGVFMVLVTALFGAASRKVRTFD